MDDVEAITLSYTMFAAPDGGKPVALAPKTPSAPRSKLVNRRSLTRCAKHSKSDRAEPTAIDDKEGDSQWPTPTPSRITTYHLVNPSPWPLIGASFAFLTAVGLIMSMKGLDDRRAQARRSSSESASLGLLYILASWWTDVIHEAETGDHSRVVQISHRYGMILFIASEVMFFVAWFWAFFDASLFTAEHIQ